MSPVGQPRTAARRRALLALSLITCVGTSCIDAGDLVFDLDGAASPSGGGGGGGGGGDAARTYFDVVMEDSPVAYYRANEMGTSAAADSSGNERHALYRPQTGSVVLSAAGALANDPDTAVTLSDGAYINFAPNTLNFSGHYSLEAWVRYNSGTVPAYLFSLGDAAPDMNTYIQSTSVVHKRHDAEGAFEQIRQDGVILDDKLHHVVVTFDGNNAQLYIDGLPMLAVPAPFALAMPLISTPLSVATSATGSSLTVDELAAYNHALTLQRIEAHYACGHEGSCE